MSERKPEPINEDGLSSGLCIDMKRVAEAANIRHAYTIPMIKRLGDWSALTLVQSVPIHLGSVFRSYGIKKTNQE